MQKEDTTITANAWAIFDVFLTQLGNELHDLHATDTLKVALHTSSWTPNTATDVSQDQLGNGVAQANGYLTGGDTVAATWVTSAGTLTHDTVDAS